MPIFPFTNGTAVENSVIAFEQIIDNFGNDLLIFSSSRIKSNYFDVFHHPTSPNPIMNFSFICNGRQPRNQNPK